MKDETKEKARNFMENVKKTFDRGVAASKKALGIAGDAVQDFSDKSILRIEKKQLETKVKKQYELLGEYVTDVFSSKKSAQISSKDSKVQDILKEIERLNKEIKIRETSLAEPSPNSKTGKEKADVPAVKKTAAKKAEPKKTEPKKASAKKEPAKKTASKTGAKKASK